MATVSPPSVQESTQLYTLEIVGACPVDSERTFSRKVHSDRATFLTILLSSFYAIRRPTTTVSEILVSVRDSEGQLL